MEITQIGINDANYPERLRNIHEPPKKLFVRGALAPQDDIAIAIVGSRKCTTYGKQAAYDLARELAGMGVTIISGMALGIDGEAHKGALDAGGRTIAVLGTGVDKQSIYPHTHQSLAERIVKQGAVLSEFESLTPAYPSNFPQRNRIISALSLGVVIVEANEKSGSLITANFALEQGKDVFAVPGPIYSANSTGTNKLIQQGAKLTLNAQDILDELGIEPIRQTTTQGNEDIPEEQRLILTLIREESASTDTIIVKTKLPSSLVLQAITMLELQRKIRRIGANTYGIKN
ncbi:DNA protecting protein DprA [Candidatus Azambacteria bacterium RIFCSPHIGHO2_02_FULL_52_12]|uniref:DNA protecting protein DprA n=1 Tax=Candidatus Azambacteria bacterium RIFCSPLOWO2_01_FULL_46_25 TaxID=1797298 RepID=A0A1F5BUA5_9BACT|nr:MAG: DNA protecting protein DprA [Candidatus Azambacteria bacterium RIFCSPHIGHO2_02_FULL_52_12]OGD34179.1 MAG: DNA protecting protein DprA [Candidatus Azambacteria bacterium RIFCSPLOWO2_01_FULL_46_25]OGD37218.1 MAG: DNA protecting protein DprA [Candidatus Azambacteria bacterium RIFCSPHIGHO2_01_FULL_51_74]